MGQIIKSLAELSVILSVCL